jgi:integrase
MATLRPRSGSHTYPRGGVYYYRRMVPVAFRPAFGCTVVSVSLGTTSDTEAERLEKAHDVLFERRLKAAKEAGNPDAVAARIADSEIIEIGTVNTSRRARNRLAEVPLTPEGREIAQAALTEALARRYEQLGNVNRVVDEIRSLLAPLSEEALQKCRDGVLAVIRHHGGDGTTLPMINDLPVMGVPIPFNAENGDDLIAKWARRRRVRPKTVYEARRIIRKLTKFVGYDDLTRLGKAHVERWIDHLDASGAASKTVGGHLLMLKTVVNFAVEQEMIADSPAAKVGYKAKVNSRNKVRAYTTAEARAVLEAARRERRDYMRWTPWLACFTGARLDEVVAADVRDIERLGRYWVLNIRLDHRDADASIKTNSSHRKVPLHPALIAEGFIDYVNGLPQSGPLFPSLKPDKFGSKAGSATKKLGPLVRSLGIKDQRLSPNHSWRHRLIDECRRIPIREDIEHAITGHAQEGTAPDYGEFAINDMLGPAIERIRSPFDVEISAAAE